MSKRGEKYERSPRDLYETIDPRAMRALDPHVDKAMAFIEPCAGGGALIDQLVGAGLRLAFASDIEPLRKGITKADARNVNAFAGGNVQFITNPPFVRKLMHEIMLHCARQAPSWFLVEADWLITQQATPIIKAHATDIVAIGRLRWFIAGHTADKGSDGKDNFVWIRLEPEPFGAPRFWPQNV